MATVLVIDDNADTLQMMLRIVNRVGYCAMGAETGEAGLAIIATKRPDLIIVDGMMPGMNGTEFIRLCRANADTATLPIILNTAVGDENFTSDAIKKGGKRSLAQGPNRN